MKRTVLVLALLSFGVVAYAGLAQGVGTASASQQGQIRYAAGEHCNLLLKFKGFAPGTRGRLELTAQGNTVVLAFQVPSRMWGWQVKVHQLFDGPHTDEAVTFRIAIEGMNHVLSNTVMVHCDCGSEGGGGSGSGGGSGGAGGSGSTVSDAGAASAVSSQPGFAG
jgi:hypothetical protein